MATKKGTEAQDAGEPGSTHSMTGAAGGNAQNAQPDPIAKLRELADEAVRVKDKLREELATIEARAAVIRESLGEPAHPAAPRNMDVQPKVLEYMQTKPGRQLDAAHVSAATGLPIESVRSALQRISKSGQIKKGSVRGAFEYPVPTEAAPPETPAVS